MLTINVMVGKAWTFVGESSFGFLIDSTANIEFVTIPTGSPVASRGHALKAGMPRSTGAGRLFVKGSGVVVATPILIPNLAHLHANALSF
jgi:hypothetical protein